MMFWIRHDVILELRRQRHLNLPDILSVQKHCLPDTCSLVRHVWCCERFECVESKTLRRGELVFEGGCAEVRVCTHICRVHVSS